MKKLLLPFLLSFIIAGELEVDGNLKVIGNIDAQNNPIKNVGLPQELTDAINGNVLQDAFRNDGDYEYKMYYVGTWVGQWWDNNDYAMGTKYKSLDTAETGELWEVKLNTLSSQGWKVLTIIPYGLQDRVFSNSNEEKYEGFISLFVLKRPLDE